MTKWSHNYRMRPIKSSFDYNNEKQIIFKKQRRTLLKVIGLSLIVGFHVYKCSHDYTNKQPEVQKTSDYIKR